MDAQFWIYIIIGVIYFLTRILKKPQEAGEVPDSEQNERRRSPQQTGQTGETPRQMTFEELLREITEGKQAQKPTQAPVPESRRQTSETSPRDEARSLERVDFDEAENARVFQKYEEAKSLALERRSLEETMQLEDTLVDFKRFEAFDRKQRRNVMQDYIKIIRDPVSLKQAVVMSEILKTKF